jgi:5-methylthioadenosine/S-adenosylhomocysteine deaminase
LSGILVKNVNVVTMQGHDRIISDAEIAIDKGKIIGVGPVGTVKPDFRPDRLIDGRGFVAMPGLINCHTHAAMTLLRGYADDLPLMHWLSEKIWPLEAKLEPGDIYWGSLLCCLEMIKSGTTTFADMYFHMPEVARAVEKSGIRACLSRGLIGVGPEAETALEQSKQFVQDWHGAANGRITTMLGPHAPYTCPPDYLKKVMALADQLAVGIHIHLAESKTEIEDITRDYNKSPVKLMLDTGVLERRVLAAHCVHLTDEDIDILAEKGVGVAHNPESNMKLASGIAPVYKMLKKGVKVGLGTDGAASNNNLDMIEEMRSASLLQKVACMDPVVLPSYETLKMATCGGAGILGLENEVGMLKEGMKADIILLNFHKPHLYPKHDLIAHMVYSAQSADVETVLIDGQVVMENRRVLTIDEEEVLSKVQEIAERLIGKK